VPTLCTRNNWSVVTFVAERCGEKCGSIAMTIFAPSKNNAVARLESLMAYGTDPGQTPPVLPATREDVDEPN
jgi:hypothetical protein